ncbi:MAG: ROK family protein [Saprospiraceae bacterium]|nr:ROK family protein [Saprospiraceae bacterium]
MLWGLDLGGTKIEGVVLAGTNHPEVVSRIRLPTESKKGYDHVINQIGRLIDQLKKETGGIPAHIGMGTPGAIDPPTGLLKNSNSTVLNGKPFHRDLEDRLGYKFVLANDANCFAIAETRMGVVPDHIQNPKLCFGVIMGTGVGGGLVINGQVHDGLQGIGGEWGHSFLDESGGACYCGQVGCVETVISGPALQRFYARESGEERLLKDIIQRHRQGSDSYASKTMERLIHFFGKGIANLINILDPDAIIIGGGVGNIDELYTEGVEKIKSFVFNPRLDTKILKPKLGDSAGVFGAAFLTP